jgi:hypothetical protein
LASRTPVPVLAFDNRCNASDTCNQERTPAAMAGHPITTRAVLASPRAVLEAITTGSVLCEPRCFGTPCAGYPVRLTRRTHFVREWRGYPCCQAGTVEAASKVRILIGAAVEPLTSAAAKPLAGAAGEPLASAAVEQSKRCADETSVAPTRGSCARPALFQNPVAPLSLRSRSASIQASSTKAPAEALARHFAMASPSPPSGQRIRATAFRGA